MRFRKLRIAWSVGCGIDDVDGVGYIEIDFAPVDAMVLWREIRSRLSAEPELARAAIVACEGVDGWDDYLLLHHYDQTLILDEMRM